MAYHKTDKKYYGYIYIIHNTINDKVYIGQTRRTVGIRWGQHLLTLHSERDGNTPLYNAIKKHGSENFYVQTIGEYSSYSKDKLSEILNQEEIRYISEYNSVRPNGYNLQPGGKSSENSLVRSVDKYSSDGILLKTYDSISDACSDNNFNSRHISECCMGKQYTSGGYVWRYHGEPFDKYKSKDKRTRTVDKYTVTGVFLKHYETFKDAIIDTISTENHLKYQSHIASCCKGERRIAYGYVWRYGGEPFDKYPNCLNIS